MFEFKLMRRALGATQHITGDCTMFYLLKDAIMKDQITLKKTLFDLRDGETLGIFGPPGSGKTTLLRFLDYTLVHHATEGQGSYAENSSHTEQSKHQNPSVRNEEYSTSRLTAMEALVEAIQPSEIAARKTRKLLKDALVFLSQEGDVLGLPLCRSSRAMVSKVTILSALLYPKEYLLLDEPTRDVSVDSLHEIHELFGNLKALGKTTVILTTIDPLEAELLCDRVVLINQGRVIAIGRTADLRHMLGPDLSNGTNLTNLHNQLTSIPPVVE